MRLRISYDDLLRRPDSEEMCTLRSGVINRMVRLALVATGQDSGTISAEFMPGGIDSYLLETLAKIPEATCPTFDDQVREGFLKVENWQSYEAVMQFLRRLGAARNSTFGLNL